MGKYEKKNRRAGGRYQRRREKRGAGKIIAALMGIAVLLVVVILLFDPKQDAAPSVQPSEETVPTQEVLQQTEETTLQQQDTSEPVPREEPKETQAAWFDDLFDRIEGREEETTAQAQSQETTIATEPPPEGTRYQRMTYMEMSSGNLVLVNGTHGFSSSMVSTTTLHDKALPVYYVEDLNLAVQSQVVEPLNEWLGAFSGETGDREILISVGYQTENPEMPEFHTGLAVELDTYHIDTTMSDDERYESLAQSAWEYGFIRRWPEEKAELTGVSGRAWHFRYVGIPHSVVMQREELCLEEYLEYIRAYTLEEGPLEVEFEGRQFEVYFCEGLEIPVPENRKYSISGNNVDGFIVTVEVTE